MAHARVRVAGGCLALLAAASAAPAQATSGQGAATEAPSLPFSAAKVLAHLNLTVDWYRRVSAVQQSALLAGDAVTRDRINRLAANAVRFAFDFGDAVAAIDASGAGAARTSAPTDSLDDAARLDRAAARMTARVAAIRSRLSDLDAQAAASRGREQAALAAQRAQVAASLALALEVQRTVQELQRFASASAALGPGGASSLRAQVFELERSVPEVRRAAASSPARAGAPGPGDSTAATPVAPAPVASAEPSAVAAGVAPSGLLAILGQWMALRSARRQLDGVLSVTDALATEIDTLRMAVMRQSRALIRANLADSTPVAPGAEAEAQRRIEDATARFKRLSTVIVPLSEQDMTVDDAQAALMEVSDRFRSRSDVLARTLALRAGLLVASIALVLILSELWRRATFRYLHDPRRRRQFLLLRRVLVAIALAVIVLMGFISEVGSLATYVGFLTAGLAVALQNVILAVVAYFFLIGRYGVRVGDRVTLAGVTGRIVDIGLIRISLMELAGPQLLATGRIVVMSNAVLFKPEALFKQIPGANYVWHSVTLSLPPTTNAAAVRERLVAAANTVYASWRPAIDAQHAAVQRQVDFDTPAPEPMVEVRFTEQAFDFTVRYPVLPEHAAANDQLMLSTLRDVVASEHPVQEPTAVAAAT